MAAREAAPGAAEGVEASLEDAAEKRSCTALTRRGMPCRLPARDGSEFCTFHTPRKPRPRRRAESESTDSAVRSRILADIDSRVQWVLERLRANGLFLDVNVPELISTVNGFLDKILKTLGTEALKTLERGLRSDYLDLDTWRGLACAVKLSFDAHVESTRMRFGGRSPIDEFGLDFEFYEAVRPLVTLIYKHWFRVETSGIENVPSEGPAMLVANHSGILPWDAVMLSEAVWDAHPQPRHARMLYLKLFASVPFVAPFLAKTGQVLACPENGRRLLDGGQLIGVFPEGVKGIGKLYKDRYKLARFGRGGFIKLALQTRSPIVPVAIVGAEEIYPALARLDTLAKILGLPYLPITPTFPWLGLLGLLPLPTKWHIHFCRPLRFNEKAREKADDYLLVELLTERVRRTVQRAIDELLRRRRSVF